MFKPFHEGEVPVKDAPLVTLKNGADCIPQHYLKYQHNLASVQKIVLSCHFDDRYPVFVSGDKAGIYIQIGIVGYDNYRPIDQQVNRKIVYGRRWRVEPELPTSEIIQTVFLALKKAREHEVRELFKLVVQDRVTTPFSCHQDLPLIANNGGTVEYVEDNLPTLDTFTVRVSQMLSRLRYDHNVIKFVDIEERQNGSILIDLKILGAAWSQLDEVNGNDLTLILKDKSINTFLFCLMERFIQLSDRYVEEHFTFQGFKRFSWRNSVQEIAELSFETRDTRHIKDVAFQNILKEVNYETDKGRVPAVLDTKLAKKIVRNLSCFGSLDGILPSIDSNT